ncbi:MAG: M14 family zinc carboxypeptidase, partial [Bacteroidales bacterium]
MPGLYNFNNLTMSFKKPFNQLLVLFSLLLVISSASPLFGINDYNTPAGVNRKINQIQSSHANLVKVHKLAVSPGGNELLMLEIGTETGSDQKTKPAILVVGNMTGIRPVTTEAALSLAERIAGDADSYNRFTWYILPLGNPDAYSRYFDGVKYSYAGNFTPFNDDMDDQVDEDGFDDLDGNGFITKMRVKAPDGEWVVVDA